KSVQFAGSWHPPNFEVEKSRPEAHRARTCAPNILTINARQDWRKQQRKPRTPQTDGSVTRREGQCQQQSIAPNWPAMQDAIPYESSYGGCPFSRSDISPVTNGMG